MKSSEKSKRKRRMNKNNLQTIYGAVLIMAGMGVFYRIPAVMEKVNQIEYFANASFLVKIVFYLFGFFVLLAGVIKIYNYKIKPQDSADI